MNNTSKHRDHSLVPDYNLSNNLGFVEQKKMMQITGQQERLEYLTKIMRISNGCEVERYLIPDEEKQKVLEGGIISFQ